MRGPRRRIPCGWLTALTIAFAPTLASADGFADLRAALARPVAATSVKGTMKVETSTRQGDEKDTDDDVGEATVDFEDGPSGLRMFYARDLLTRADHETRAKERDAKAKTPATSGMRAADATALRAMLAPTTAVSTLLDDCAPRGEVAEDRNGRPTRRLSCEYGLSKLKGRDRKFVKTYEGKVDIWIDAAGLPVATSVDNKLTGRAYVVISFETSSHVEQTFQIVGGRLINVREDRRSSGSGAGEKGEGHTVRLLTLSP